DSASELAEALAPFAGPRGLASVAHLRAAYPSTSGEGPDPLSEAATMDLAMAPTLPATATTIPRPTLAAQAPGPASPATQIAQNSPSLTPVAVTDEAITVRPLVSLARRLAAVGAVTAAIVSGVGLGIGPYFAQRGQGGPGVAAGSSQAATGFTA